MSLFGLPMWDKLDLRIPFDDLHVLEYSPSKAGERRGMLRISDYDFPATASICFLDGKAQINSAPTAQKWGSISSSISTVAVGFFPEGNGFYPWPHVSLKASPNKILQGHNVFGTENIRHGALQMLANLKEAFPKISQHLDFQNAEVRFLDSTYSACVPSEFKRNQLLKLLESLFPNKHDISRYTGYLQANKSSDYHRQKVYYKGAELLADLHKAKSKNDLERASILSDPRLHDFVDGRLRFEATTGHRALERMGIPTKFFEFLKFHDWFQSVHKQPLCQYLWHKAFDKVLSQIEGHTMKDVDDNHVRLQIDARYIVLKAKCAPCGFKTDDTQLISKSTCPHCGESLALLKPCKRRANAVFRTYRDIKHEGYDQLASEKNATFFRNVKALIELGFSKAFLKSLDPQKPNANVIPMVQLISIDFSQQRPGWYVEPVSGFDDPRRNLRLVS